MSILEVAEGKQEQSADEIQSYTITTTNVVSNPTTVTCVAIDETTGETVTSSVFDPTSGAGTNSGDVITCPKLQTLVKGHTYRIEVKWVVGSNTFERYFRVECPI